MYDYNTAIKECIEVIEKYREKVKLMTFYNELFLDIIRELRERMK